MTDAACYRRIALSLTSLLLAASLAAQSHDAKTAVSLTVVPARMTLTQGESERLSAHIEGAPAGTVIVWVMKDKQKAGSSISADGLFTAQTLGVYHVMALAVAGDKTVLKTAVAKITVVGRIEL